MNKYEEKQDSMENQIDIFRNRFSVVKTYLLFHKNEI